MRLRQRRALLRHNEHLEARESRGKLRVILFGVAENGDVVPAEALQSHVDEIARAIAAKPGYALRTTKQQVNAVTEEIAGTGRNTSDADALVFATHDEESRRISREYLKSKKKG